MITLTNIRNKPIVKNNSRDSSFELLRIISMLMIVLHHVIYHGVPLCIQKSDNILIMNSELSIYQKLLLELFNCSFIYGVNIFILISGYYGIKFNFKKFLNLYLLICIYNLINLSMWPLIGIKVYSINIINAFMPLSHPHSWFIKEYMILFLISPIINTFTTNTTKRTMQLIIVIFLFLLCYLGFMLKIMPFQGGMNIWQFVLLYLIGQYINKFIVHNHLKKSYYFYKFIFCNFLLFIIVSFSIIFMKKHTYMPIHLLWYNNPLLIITSIYMFMIFRNFKFNNKYVNWVSSSILSIYLIQEGSEFVFYKHIYKLISIYYWENDTIIFILYIVIYVLVLFVVSIAIDKSVKKYMINPCSDSITCFFKMVYNKTKNIYG